MAIKNKKIEVGPTKDLIGQWTTIYDTIPLVDGLLTAALQQFFVVQKGQTNGFYNKTLSDTNLTQPGLLPKGLAFRIHYISFNIILGSAQPPGAYPISLIQLINARSNIEFFINTVPRINAPLQKFEVFYNNYIPAVTAVGGMNISSNHPRPEPKGWSLQQALKVEPLEAIQMDWRIDDDVSLGGLGIDGKTRIQCVMEGWLNKPAV